MKMITNEDDDESEDNLNSHLPSMKQIPGNNDLILLLHIKIIQNDVQDDDGTDNGL